MAPTTPHRIDTHSHFIPPCYRKALEDAGIKKPDGMPAIPEWTTEAHLRLMEDNNISKSILSISSPGTYLIPGDNAAAAKLTRECNAYAANLKKQMPDRFGYFASLPIPDVETCLREIDLSIKEGCDGFVMETNGHGIYPGDPLLGPIFDELSKRNAILFIHPTTPNCLCDHSNADSSTTAPYQKAIHATPLEKHYPIPMFEFLFDTARFVIHMFLSGTIHRCPGLRVILPHLGGTVIPLLSRFSAYSGMLPGPWTPVTEADIHEAFAKRFWFDLAGVPFPSQIRGALAVQGITSRNLLYGSDYPFTPSPAVAKFGVDMDDGAKVLFSEEELKDVYHRNAERLLNLGS